MANDLVIRPQNLSVMFLVFNVTYQTNNSECSFSLLNTSLKGEVQSFCSGKLKNPVFLRRAEPRAKGNIVKCQFLTKHVKAVIVQNHHLSLY